MGANEELGRDAVGDVDDARLAGAPTFAAADSTLRELMGVSSGLAARAG